MTGTESNQYATSWHVEIIRPNISLCYASTVIWSVLRAASNVALWYRCSEKRIFATGFASRHVVIYSLFSLCYVKRGDSICMWPISAPTRPLKTATLSPGNGHDWCLLSLATVREDPRLPAISQSPLLTSCSFRLLPKKGGFTSRPAPWESIPDVLPEWNSAAYDPGSPTLQPTSHWTLFKSPVSFYHPLLVSSHE